MYGYGKCCKEVGVEIYMYLDLDDIKLPFAINEHNYGHICRKYDDDVMSEIDWTIFCICQICYYLYS